MPDGIGALPQTIVASLIFQHAKFKVATKRQHLGRTTTFQTVQVRPGGGGAPRQPFYLHPAVPAGASAAKPPEALGPWFLFLLVVAQRLSAKPLDLCADVQSCRSSSGSKRRGPTRLARL